MLAVKIIFIVKTLLCFVSIFVSAQNKLSRAKLEKTLESVFGPGVFPPACGYRWPKCPSNIQYRSYDGYCTNPLVPESGVPGDRFTSMLTPIFEDNIKKPRTMYDGIPLPNPRSIRNSVFPDGEKKSAQWNLLAMSYGQFMTHDMSHFVASKNVKCCTQDGKFSSTLSANCMAIKIPDDDIIAKAQNVTCMNFTRAETDQSIGCSKSMARGINCVSACLDLSLIYGHSNAMRVPGDIYLKTKKMNNREYLPTVPSKRGGCNVSYVTGDDRVDQNLPLTILHTILTKHHNILASKLKRVNPHWNNDKIFSEARKINIAEYQFITYYEWLPFLLGFDQMTKKKLIHLTIGHINDFNPKVNTAPSNEFIHAAFRYMHSCIPNVYELQSANRTVLDTMSVSDNFFCQDILEKPGIIDQITVGLSMQPMAEIDHEYASSITQHFDKKNNQTYGVDLKSIDIQRGRDMALQNYCAYREKCKVGPCNTFEDLLDWIPKKTVAALENMYGSPKNIDLSVGGSLERHMPDTNIGPTYSCILFEQFQRTRRGDKYWFEHVEAGFTVRQIHSIRQNSSIARYLCNSNQGIDHVQLQAFNLVDDDLNPLVSCKDVPDIDINAWEEKLKSDDLFVPEDLDSK